MKFYLFVLSRTKGESERAALRTAIGLAKGSPKIITIVVPAKRHATGKPLTYVLSESQVDLLVKGEFVKIADDAFAVLESNQTLRTKPENQIIVAIRAWSDLIPKIQKVSGIEHLLVVAPTEAEAETWKKEFAVLEHNTYEATPVNRHQ